MAGGTATSNPQLAQLGPDPTPPKVCVQRSSQWLSGPVQWQAGNYYDHQVPLRWREPFPYHSQRVGCRYRYIEAPMLESFSPEGACQGVGLLGQSRPGLGFLVAVKRPNRRPGELLDQAPEVPSSPATFTSNSSVLVAGSTWSTVDLALSSKWWRPALQPPLKTSEPFSFSSAHRPDTTSSLISISADWYRLRGDAVVSRVLCHQPSPFLAPTPSPTAICADQQKPPPSQQLGVLSGDPMPSSCVTLGGIGRHLMHIVDGSWGK